MDLRVIAKIVWVLLTLPVLGMTLLLAVSTVTLEGGLVSGGLLVTWFSIPALLSIYELRSRFEIGASFAFACGITSVFVAWILAPSTTDGQHLPAGVSTHYGGSSKFRSWTPSNLVPEVDQVLMGSRLFSTFDPYLSSGQSERLRQSIRQIYEPMREEAEFHDIPSVLGQVYSDAFSSKTPTGHRFVYLPDSISERRPVILFLHGSLGNFKGYLWVWKSLADDLGFALVAPSFGVGEWRNEDGLRTVEEALAYCQQRPEFDPERIFLAGISNGGAGLTHAAPHFADALAGLIYLSPVIDPDRIDSDSFSLNRSLACLIVSGDSDRRVPVKYVERGAMHLRDAGLKVETHFIPGEDHFLFFSQPTTVQGILSSWLIEQSSNPIEQTN